MGITIGVSKSSYEPGPKPKAKVGKKFKAKSLPNPNPRNYKILEHEQIENFLLIKVKYLDCTNYEGNKIMVYECDMGDLVRQKSIDPHFSNNPNFNSPIARFEPTKRGWELARLLIYATIEMLKIEKDNVKI